MIWKAYTFLGHMSMINPITVTREMEHSDWLALITCSAIIDSTRTIENVQTFISNKKSSFFFFVNRKMKKGSNNKTDFPPNGKKRVDQGSLCVCVCVFQICFLGLCPCLWWSTQYDWKPIIPKGSCKKRQCLFPYRSTRFSPCFYRYCMDFLTKTYFVIFLLPPPPLHSMSPHTKGFLWLSLHRVEQAIY